MNFDLSVLMQNKELWMPLLALGIGWVLPQPAVVGRLWGFVMGGSKAVDRLQEVVNTVDAVLKARGIIDKDAADAVVADIDAKVSPYTDKASETVGGFKLAGSGMARHHIKGTKSAVTLG